MATDFAQFGTVVDAPIPKKKSKSLLGSIGGFLAPTLTETVSGARKGEKVTGRQLLGSALEIGSLAIPAGAIARGFGLVGRAGKAALGIKKAKGFEAIKEGVSTGGKKLVSATKTGAQVGTVSGGLAGSGRALGDEDKTVTEVLGEGAVGALAGGVGGAVLTPVASLAGMTARKVSSSVSDAFNKTKLALNPQDRVAAVDDLSRALRESFVEDKTAVINKLEKIARRSKDNISEDDLLKELVDEGLGIPEVDGTIARFKGSIEALEEKRGVLARGLDTFLAPSKRKTQLDSLRIAAQDVLEGRIDVDLVRSERQLTNLFKSLEKKYGKVLSDQQVNKVRAEMNKSTKAFKGDQFIQDSADAVADAARARLDELGPEAREINGEIGRLFRITRTAEALNNRPIDVGFLAGAMGRFIGTVGLGSIGFKVAGPGGLVVAGIAANLGAKGLANVIRQARFNKNAQRILSSGIRNDKKLLTKILKKATPEDAKVIREFAGDGEKVLSSGERNIVRRLTDTQSLGGLQKTNRRLGI